MNEICQFSPHFRCYIPSLNYLLLLTLRNEYTELYL